MRLHASSIAAIAIALAGACSSGMSLDAATAPDGGGINEAGSADGSPGDAQPGDESDSIADSGKVEAEADADASPGIDCCADAPSVADNPPIPAGWMLLPQSAVTPEMTAWAVMILDDPSTYPQGSTTTQVFGTLDVMARVEWHPPDFTSSAVHRGVTLYEPV
jgi:hypothetical protein